MIFFRIYGVGAEQNEKKSLVRDIDFHELALSVQRNSIHERLLKMNILPQTRLWDFGKKASEHINVGDTVYILIHGKNEKKVYHTRIHSIISDSGGEIGDAVGWHRIHKGPWENPMILHEVVRLKGLFDIISKRLVLKLMVMHNLYAMDSS